MTIKMNSKLKLRKRLSIRKLAPVYIIEQCVDEDPDHKEKHGLELEWSEILVVKVWQYDKSGWKKFVD